MSFRLDSYILGFASLSIEQQNQFLSHEELQIFIADLKNIQQRFVHLSDPILNRSNQTYKNNLNKQRLRAFEASVLFAEIKKAILVQKLQKLFFILPLLTEEEQDLLYEQTYVQELYYHDDKHACLQAFFHDVNPDIHHLRIRIETIYLDLFGFLFRDKQFTELHEIADRLYLSDISSSEKKKYLSQELSKEWQSLQDFMKCFWNQFQNALYGVIKAPWNDSIEYIDDIANAHAIYRFFGLSSDNFILGINLEANYSPIINILDLYNYHKNRKTIREVLGVWHVICLPLNPFFEEYIEIGKFEKNFFNICIRAFMPFLVMASFLTLGYSLLLPLALHQFIEYLLFIPTLYLALAIAGLYVICKNNLYSAYLDYYYDGIYNSPQFTANQRMRDAFHACDHLAEDLAVYYTQRFQLSDEIEQMYASKNNSLTSEQLASREQNLKLKFSLYVEWFNLHDSDSIGIDELPKMVESRLKEDHDFLIKQLEILSKLYIDKHRFSFFRSEGHDAFKANYCQVKEKVLFVESLLPKLEQSRSVMEIIV